jgi:REP element-mobilizing transposase RayT
MPVRRTIPYDQGIYFITFTCWKWAPLIQLTNGYYAVYNWFDVLKAKGHYLIGYVIMPNHIHALLAFRNTQGQSINSIVGNGKRFIAYEIVRQLKNTKEDQILNTLKSAVRIKDKMKGKIHELFEPSFDWKSCETEKLVEQKLAYIHNNPCSGKWNLVESPWDYAHSSAKFYFTGKQGVYEILNYQDLDDIDLTVPLIEDS